MLNFNPDDKIRYVGAKYSRQLANLVGKVVTRVGGSERKYVVEFAIPIKDGFNIESFIVDYSSLMRYTPSLKEEKRLEQEMAESLLKTKMEAGEPVVKKSRRRMVDVG